MSRFAPSRMTCETTGGRRRDDGPFFTEPSAAWHRVPWARGPLSMKLGTYEALRTD